MNQNKAIREVEAGFRLYYLEAIRLLFQKTESGKATGHYLSFSTIFSGIECLAALYSGKRISDRQNHTRFLAFMGKYFQFSPNYTATMNDELWRLRCSLAHSFSCGPKFTLTHANPDYHFQAIRGRTHLNAESFLNDFEKAADKYFDDLKSVSGIREKFAAATAETGVFRPGIMLPPLPTKRRTSYLIVGKENLGTNVRS